jgi:hypothetical protein
MQWGYASLADAVQAWYDEVRAAAATAATSPHVMDCSIAPAAVQWELQLLLQQNAT